MGISFITLRHRSPKLLKENGPAPGTAVTGTLTPAPADSRTIQVRDLHAGPVGSGEQSTVWGGKDFSRSTQSPGA